jgi:hypothetical protein
MWEAESIRARGRPRLVPWEEATPSVQETWRDCARAAIRAVTEHGGLVVGKMPQEAASNHSMGLWGDGYNTAIAEVRANAVKVEGV